MRPPADMPAPPSPIARRLGSSRGRTALVVAALALFTLFTSMRGIAGFYTDFLWFDSLGFGDVWSGVLGAKVSLAVIFFAAFFALCWLNLFIADRVGPQFLTGPDTEALERFREVVGPRIGLFRFTVAGLLGLMIGTPMAGEWRSWLLFVNGGSWGARDAQFDTDIGFYVFELPFLSAVTDWAFTALLVVFVVTTAAHFANGGIRVQPPGAATIGPRVGPQVKAHLSVLLGLIALVRAVSYYLQRYALTTSSRGVVDGASYTDVKAQLPALNLLVLISIAASILFVVNIWRRGWVLPVLAVGLWALIATVAGGIYPQVIQRVQVSPNESQKEAEYIGRNIAATREAYGLTGVETVSYPLNRDVDEVDLVDDADVVRNIRLWDPDQTEQTFSKLQELLTFYRIDDVDVDRYEIDGELTQVVLSARELHSDGVQQSSWEARHLTYTHGYGVVMAPGTTKTRTGEPDFVIADVPLDNQTDLTTDRPQIYFGEGLGGYSITGGGRRELDYQVGDETEFTTYDGTDGVGIGSLLRQVAFSLRFGDVNPLISKLIDSDSKIHYLRDPRERVQLLAPFLHIDADPYPVITETGISWILDAYTTTDRFPYSQRAATDQLPEGSGLDQRFNYVRNSVKAVVDAYDGTVRLYVVDQDDPIIRAWRKAFPELFVDGDEMPEDLRAHIRYPEDLFRVQTNTWGRYHVENPEVFYNNNDAWNVARDPDTVASSTTPTTAGAQAPAAPRQATRIEPYYLLTRLPGEEDPGFVILRPFVPAGNDSAQQLTAFMVAESDGESYGRIRSYVMPREDRPEGPANIAALISSDTQVAREETLLNQSGSRVRFGNLVLIPVDDSLLYVRPFYVESQQQGIPQLKQVIAVFEDQVEIADTLEEALKGLFGEVPSLGEVVGGAPLPEEPGGPEDPETPEEPEGSVQEQAARLLEEAEGLFDEADAALAAGDLGTYQEAVEEAQELVRQAFRLLGGTTTTTAPGATTTTAPEQEPA